MSVNTYKATVNKICIFPPEICLKLTSGLILTQCVCIAFSVGFANDVCNNNNSNNKTPTHSNVPRRCYQVFSVLQSWSKIVGRRSSVIIV